MSPDRYEHTRERPLCHILDCRSKTARFSSDKNKARVNAFYFNYLPPRSLSWKTHGVSLYAKLATISEMTIEYAEKHI